MKSLRRNQVRNETKPLQPSAPFGWPQKVTLAIAIWGAVVSSAVAVKQYLDVQPVIYVRTQVQRTGIDSSGKPVGKIYATFTNTGQAPISISPDVKIIVIDSRTGEKSLGVLEFSDTPQLKESAGKRVPGAPAFLTPGQEAVAETYPVSLVTSSNPLSYLAVQFTTTNEAKYQAFISQPSYFSEARESGELTSWSGGAIAEKKSWF